MKTQKEIAQFLKHHLETVKKNNLTVVMHSVVIQFDTKTHCGTVCCMAGWLPFTYPNEFRWVVEDESEEEEGEVSVVSNEGIDATDYIEGIPSKLTDYLFGMGSLLDYPYYPFINMSSSFEEVAQAWEKVIADLEQEKFPL